MKRWSEKDIPEQTAHVESVPALWVTFNYSRGVSQISQVSMVWEGETPEQIRDTAARMAKSGDWYRLGNINTGVICFPAAALLDINIKLATPAQVEMGHSGAGAAKLP